MPQTTLLLIIVAAVLTGGLTALTLTVGRTRPRLSAALKALVATLIPLALAGTVVTSPSFYLHRPALLVYMGTPALVGVIWTAYKIEAANPGRISGMIRGNQRRRTAPGRARQPRIITSFPRALRGWLNLAIFEDKLPYRFVHIGAITAGWVIAATFPSPLAYGIPFAVVLISTVRWMKVQSARSALIARVYAIAASHLDYSRAVNSRLTSGGAQFASATGAINVEWIDLTTPTRITVAFPVTFAKTNLEKRSTFENEFDATLPGAGWKFDWDTTATIVTITVATYPSSVRWELRTPEKWSQFYIGDQLDDGSQVTFDLESESPHALIAGETGTGKTEAMFVVAAQALQKGWDVAICDPKETGWAMWTRRRRPTNEAGHDTGAAKLRDGDARPGVIEHAVELYGIRDVLQRCIDEMQRRKKVNGANKVVKWTELPDEVKEQEHIKPLMVVVDEALSLFDMEKGGTDEIKERNEVRGQALGLMQKLIIEARALGIHVLLGIQRPDAAVLGGAMRSNLGARIACGVMEPTGYQMMFQVTSGVPRLVVNGADGKKVIGRALVRSSPGQPIVPVQVAWLGKGQVDLEQVAPMPPEPEQEDETPTGPFNPYAQFDDPSPWLRDAGDGGGVSDPPPWETLPTAQTPTARGSETDTPPWEAAGPEVPPWERAPVETPPWESTDDDTPPWEKVAPAVQQATPVAQPPAVEAPPWEQPDVETPPWERASAWESLDEDGDPEGDEDLADLMSEVPHPGRAGADRAPRARVVRPAGAPTTAPKAPVAQDDDAPWITEAPAWEPYEAQEPQAPSAAAASLPVAPAEDHASDMDSDDTGGWWG